MKPNHVKWEGGDGGSCPNIPLLLYLPLSPSQSMRVGMFVSVTWESRGRHMGQGETAEGIRRSIE